VPVAAPFAVALDAPTEEIEALIDVGDQSLVRGQAQTYPGQDFGDLLLEGLGVAAGARNGQAPVIGLCRLPGYAAWARAVQVGSPLDGLCSA
jgi:hypothetical protein